MPKLKDLSKEEGEKVEELLREAQSRTLTPEELKEVAWILSPITDTPSDYFVGDPNIPGGFKRFYFDHTSGELYTVLDNGERSYVGFIPDNLSSFMSGGSGGRGGGIFARLAPTAKRLTIPLPPFPKIPPNVKSKFPELKESWDNWEDSVDKWVQYVQTQLS